MVMVLANNAISDGRLDPRAHAATAVTGYSTTSGVFTPATVPYSSLAFTSNAAGGESFLGKDSALIELKTLVNDPILGELMDAR